MNSQEIQHKIDDLKLEYINLQGDIEKLESTGHSIEKLEKRLTQIENELQSLRTKQS
ncbi:SE1832 family protein [Bacillus weihaiensis]|uniref:SE1832 family protein n=1 Tax=Bacillus weihaiensis TaxID=1547283 RepID=UPI000AA9AECB|nr:SE1832 family protein [Bacillus weihaiensis]